MAVSPAMGCASSSPKDSEPEEQLTSAYAASPTKSSPPNFPEDPRASEGNMARRRSVAHQSPEIDAGPVATTFDEAKVGSLSRHGIAPTRGATGVTSKAKINQDRGVVCWPFNGSHNQALLCIFDGHGMQGERVSEWCMQQIPARLEAQRQQLKVNPQTVLERVIPEMDHVLLTHPKLAPVARGAGTTSNVLYFNGNRVWVACSGDSRAVMGRMGPDGITAVDLSYDHKPDLPLERERIERCGGVVSAAGPRGLPPSRVWVNGRVGLAMSRSLGDGEAKTHGVVPDPEVCIFDLQPYKQGDKFGDKFVIVASDGIWEFISSQQACDIVDKHPNAYDACTELVKTAEQRWRDEEGSYRDDITCIVAFLPFLEERPGDDDGTGVLDSAEYPEIEPDMGDAADGSSPMGGRGKNFSKKTSEEEDDEGEQFVKRRLSVAAPFGGDPDMDA